MMLNPKTIAEDLMILAPLLKNKQRIVYDEMKLLTKQGALMSKM